MRSRGFTLPELLAALAIAAALAAVAIPATASLSRRARGAAAARELASEIGALRWQAVTSRRQRGLLFDRDASGWRWRIVEDGNGNGLRTAEVRSGTDRTLSPVRRLEWIVEGARLGFPGPGPFPAIPPGAGTIANLDDPVKFGRSDLVSFSPLGRASSGTLYLTPGPGELYAVVLFGPTTRVRVWRFDPAAGRWLR